MKLNKIEAERQVGLTADTRIEPAYTLVADSDEVAPAYRDDVARDSDMMSPPGPVSLAMGLLALSRLSSTVLLI